MHQKVVNGTMAYGLMKRYFVTIWQICLLSMFDVICVD